MGMMPHQLFVYDGKSSGDFGVWISGTGTYDAPTRDIKMISIPGRNGDLTIDNGRFSNITVKYPAFISKRFEPRIDDFRAWLCSHYAYARLEDTYHPDEFRLALYKDGLSVETFGRNTSGQFDITFTCKPQRFLKLGEIPVRYSAAGKILNPTEYEAKPLIHCVGAGGTVTIGDVTVSVSRCSAFVDIDCELMEVYEGSNNRNGVTTLNNGAFPTIKPGEWNVSFTGFTRVEIVPRWWQI